ncbi:hypothetical protein BN130_868 [Cronobacter malonaticus 507]|nr:hypothetical protein BN130_868 [Cronobacter malonaticus 507]
MTHAGRRDFHQHFARRHFRHQHFLDLQRLPEGLDHCRFHFHHFHQLPR